MKLAEDWICSFQMGDLTAQAWGIMAEHIIKVVIPNREARMNFSVFKLNAFMFITSFGLTPLEECFKMSLNSL